jgi:uncharacterized protein YkwD
MKRNHTKDRKMNRGIKLIYTAVTMAFVLNACGGGSSTVSDNTSGIPAVSGILTEAPVGGAKYMCGKVTSTTGVDGNFACDTLPVSFYVGNIKLGEIYQLPDDGFVTPQDLIGVARDVYDDNVAKIAVLLQSLDDDGKIETTITLDKALIEKLKEQHTDIRKMTHTELMELLDQLGIVHIIQKEEALSHLHTHMAHLHTTPHTETHIPDTGTPDTPSSTPDSTTASEDLNTSENTVTVPDENNGTAQNSTNVPVLDDALKQTYLDAVNEARSEGRECGKYGYMPAVTSVTWNNKLYDAAYEHSKDMAESNTFSHTGSGTASDETAQVEHPGEGSGVGERIEHNGYTDWHRYGENIAAGTVMDDISEAMEGWLKSPGHCKNIMKKEFKEVGVAVYYKEGSHYTYYWTQDFGTK